MHDASSLLVRASHSEAGSMVTVPPAVHLQRIESLATLDLRNPAYHFTLHGRYTNCYLTPLLAEGCPNCSVTVGPGGQAVLDASSPPSRFSVKQIAPVTLLH